MAYFEDLLECLNEPLPTNVACTFRSDPTTHFNGAKQVQPTGKTAASKRPVKICFMISKSASAINAQLTDVTIRLPKTTP